MNIKVSTNNMEQELEVAKQLAKVGCWQAGSGPKGKEESYYRHNIRFYGNGLFNVLNDDESGTWNLYTDPASGKIQIHMQWSRVIHYWNAWMKQNNEYESIIEISGPNTFKVIKCPKKL